MKPGTGLWTTLVLLAASTPVLLAQDIRSEGVPALPSPILGPQLVLWSQLQRPQPVPQPVPDPPSEREGKQVTPVSPSTSEQTSEQTSTITVAGRIARDGGKYVLKVGKEAPYALDDQHKAEQYDNKEVRVHGKLDENSRQLHILGIEFDFLVREREYIFNRDYSRQT